MAVLGNKENTEKKFATDEDGMMKDAKAYAKQDFKSVVETFKKLGIKELPNGNELTEEIIAKALISVKLQQIKDSRLNRVTYFD